MCEARYRVIAAPRDGAPQANRAALDHKPRRGERSSRQLFWHAGWALGADCPTNAAPRKHLELKMDSLSMFSLAGKRALITGSSRGIGFAIAGSLSAAGADVILNGRDKVALGEACDTLAKSGA